MFRALRHLPALLAALSVLALPARASDTLPAPSSSPSAIPAPGSPLPAPSSISPAPLSSPSAIPAPSSPLPAPSSSAGLVFPQTELRHVVTPGQEKLETAFPFVNRADTPVTILEARATCGCTVPTLAKNLYAPGESGEIHVTFAPGSRQGPQRLPVTVRTDHGDHALQLLVDIPQRVEFTPRLVHFRGGEPGPKTARLRFLVDTPVTLEALPIADPAFQAAIRPVEPGVEYEISLTYTGSAADARTAFLDLQSRSASGRPAQDRLFLRHAP